MYFWESNTLDRIKAVERWLTEMNPWPAVEYRWDSSVREPGTTIESERGERP